MSASWARLPAIAMLGGQRLVTAPNSRDNAMRLATATSTLCVGLMMYAAPMKTTSAADASYSAAASTPAAAASPPAPAPAPSDDAEKHAKRTACLKEAKAKKLVGAEKSEFLRTCIAGP